MSDVPFVLGLPFASLWFHEGEWVTSRLPFWSRWVVGLVLVFYGADIAIVGLLALPFPVAPRG